MKDIGATETILEELRAIALDEESGATLMTLRAADLLLRAFEAGCADRVIEGLFVAKPMMAPLLNLACLAGGDQARVQERVRAFRDNLVKGPACAARQAVRLLELMGTKPWNVLTLSASRVVEETLLAMAARGALTSVVVAESRPRLEGDALARRLADLMSPKPPRISVTYDAALPGLCTAETLVLLGADAVLPDAFVNKSGTLAICLAAREVGGHNLVVTTSHKVLRPEALPYFWLPGRDHVAKHGEIAFLDIQFERVSRSLVEAVVTEEGVLPQAGAS